MFGKYFHTGAASKTWFYSSMRIYPPWCIILYLRVLFVFPSHTYRKWKMWDVHIEKFVLANLTSEEECNHRPVAVGAEQHYCSVMFGYRRNGSLVKLAHASGYGCCANLMALPEATEFLNYKQVMVIEFYEMFIPFLLRKFYIVFTNYIYCIQGCTFYMINR
jgi:hypothetical protein